MKCRLTPSKNIVALLLLGGLHSTIPAAEATTGKFPSTDCDNAVNLNGLPKNFTQSEAFQTVYGGATLLLQLIKASNASRIDAYQCQYKAAMYEDGSFARFQTVVTAAAVCTANTTDCTVVARYDNQTCAQANLCQRSPKASFTTDCSGISASYSTCKLKCVTNDQDDDDDSNSNVLSMLYKNTKVTGMETCALVNNEAPDNDDDAPSPSPPKSGVWSHAGMHSALSLFLMTLGATWL